jgi:hypothetical protein
VLCCGLIHQSGSLCLCSVLVCSFQLRPA